MNLEILLPFRIFARESGVLRVIAETNFGSFGLLPHRLDCVAALVPGILSYETTGATVYVAVDTGVLVKAGAEVLVSVRHAIGGVDLDQLHAAVKREFLALDQQQLEVRAAVARMEGGFMRRLAEFEHERRN
jgi:F-type H+-transporting ATPase subunit epsilon